MDLPSGSAERMSEEVFRMLDEDPGAGGRQERGWSVFPEEEEEGAMHSNSMGSGPDARPSAELDGVSDMYSRDTGLSSGLSTRALGETESAEL